MSNSPVANENMIPQGPPIVNQQNTNTNALVNNVIEHHCMHTSSLASPAQIHPPRLERRNNSRAPVLMRINTLCPPLLERNEPVCHEQMLDSSQFIHDRYGLVLEHSDFIRHMEATDTPDLIQPSILTRSGFIPPPRLIRNDSRPEFDNDNDDVPHPLIRLGSDIFPHVCDFTCYDEYDIVQQANFEWFPPEQSPTP